MPAHGSHGKGMSSAALCALLVLSYVAVMPGIAIAGQFEDAMAAQSRESGGSLIVLPDNFTFTNRTSVISLAARFRLPAIYAFRVQALDGGLISYGPETSDLYRRAASYIDRILRGASPADMPVQQPTKYEMVINLKTAKALGLEVPSFFQQRADEVIE